MVKAMSFEVKGVPSLQATPLRILTETSVKSDLYWYYNMMKGEFIYWNGES